MVQLSSCLNIQNVRLKSQEINNRVINNHLHRIEEVHYVQWTSIPTRPRISTITVLYERYIHFQTIIVHSGDVIANNTTTPQHPSPPPTPNHHGVVCSHFSQPSNCSPPNHEQLAKNIESWQRKMIIHMICSNNRLSTSQMAKVAQCSECSITNIRKNLRLFGSARSPLASVGPQRSIAPYHA
jgi:hypothetical protein